MNSNAGNANNGRSDLEMRSKALFDRTVDAVDADMRVRLRRARRSAVAAAERKPAVPRFLHATQNRWAAVAASMAIAAVIGFGQLTKPPAVDAEALGDLELLLGEEDWDMLEDLDFYAWLEEQLEFDRAPAAVNGSG